MIWALLAAHVVGAAVVFVAADRRGPAGLATGAVVPAVTAVWAGWLLAGERVATAEVTWVAGSEVLGLEVFMSYHQGCKFYI